MGKYDVDHIPLELIDKNPFNPAGRGDEGDIKTLLHSITESGLYYPILVNKRNGRYVVIEGHRRLAVFHLKKEKNPDFASIPALVLNVGEEYLTRIFREINETTKKLPGKQWLDVYSKGASKDDLPSRLAPSIVALGRLFTREELKAIAQRQGPTLYGLARRVTDFVELSVQDPVDLRRVAAWLVNSGDSVNVRIAMQEGHKDRIRNAIKGQRRMNGDPFPQGEVVSGEAAHDLDEAA